MVEKSLNKAVLQATKRSSRRFPEELTRYAVYISKRRKVRR